MDDTNRQRRLKDSLGQHASVPKYNSQPHAGLVGSGRSDRFHLSTSTSPQTPRTLGANAGYNYYQEPSNSFSSSANMNAYGSEYGQDGRQQSQQNFGSYNTAAMMYSVAQPSPQTPVYDTQQQFGTRQSAALSMMTPDVTSSYFGTDPSSTSASSIQQPTQGANTSNSVYQPHNSALTYAANMSGVGGVQQAPGSADVSINEDAEFSENALEEKWITYQRQLSTVFQDITSGTLESASETLLTISDWLLSQVVDLGLTVDDANLHAGRIKLWNDFNHAWLALGQRQKDLALSGAQVSRSQSLLSRDTIEKMGNELVRLCNGLERHGLVDYQYGVWEDEIMADCLDLYDADEEANDTTGPR